MNKLTKLSLLALGALGSLALLSVWLRQRPSGGASPAATAESAASAPAATAPDAVTSIPTQQPAPAFPSLLAEARVGRPGPDALPITDRFEKAPVIWSTERTGGANNEFIQRIRLVRTEMKYPLVRLEEVLRRTPTPAGGTGEVLLQQLAMVGDHLLAKPQPGMTADRFAAGVARVGGRIRTHLRASGNYLVEVPSTSPEALPQILAALRASGVTPTAEPDYLVYTAKTPNDPDFVQLWGFHNTGTDGRTADADIDAPEAWDIATGSRSIVVGIIDTGIDYTHPDLAANMWTNPGEIPGNGVDDDNNGFVDDVRGWDFVYNDNDPMDDYNHGTHCAGTIGAVGDNGVGVAGINWRVSLVSLKFIDAGGSGPISDGIEAIDYARKMGINLTSNSWGGCGYSQLMVDAIAAAGTQGGLFVAAAGNEYHDSDAIPFYPASFGCPNIISVAATDGKDARADFSNYGATTVDLAAPGVDILSTVLHGGYARFRGTSMATPHVTGTAALLKATYPQLSGPEIKSLLLTATDPVPSQTGKSVTGGRLNAARALQAGTHLVVTAEELNLSGSCGGPFAPASTTFTLHNLGNSAKTFTVAADDSWLAVSTTGGSIPAGGISQFTVSLAASASSLLAGEYASRVVITEPANGHTISRPARLQVLPPVAYSFDLDSDPGWSRTGQWAFGPPQGMGGSSANNYSASNPDPACAFTGANVLGINLAGDYARGVTGPDYATTGPIDLTGYTRTCLRFRRWLNQESPNFARASVEISTDGLNWNVVWTNDNETTDSAWTLRTYDLSTYADLQPTVYLRWGHQTFGGAWNFSGWNIDDIEILGQPLRSITFAPLAPVAETVGAIATSLHLDPAPSEPTTITLSSSLPTTVTLPASVVAPAGATSVPITLTVHDDALLNGTREASLGIHAVSYLGHTAKLLVHDSESATLALTLPASATEGGPASNGTVTCSAAPASPVSIRLTANPTNQLTIPATVILPAGTTSVEFPIAFPDNNRIDRTTVVTLTASVVGWTTGTKTIAVQDNEATTLTLELPGTVAEGDDSRSGTVRLAGTLPASLTVALASNDTSELIVPSTVVIPAGATSSTFPLQVVNDGVSDGAHAVTVSASAAGFSTGQATTTVADATVHHFSIDPIPSPQYSGQAFTVRLTARDQNGNIAAGYQGAAALSATSSGSAIPISPTGTGAFVRGVRNEPVTLSRIAAAVSLRIEGSGASGTSNTFEVQAPSVQCYSLANTDLAYSSQTGRFYASTSEGTLVPIDPTTTLQGAPVAAAPSAISRLVVSRDGTQLHAVHSANRQVTRLPTATLTPAPSFPLGINGETAFDLVPVPGQPTAVAVAIANSSGGTASSVAVFDQGIRRSTTLAVPEGVLSLAAGGQAGQVLFVNGGGEPYPLNRAQVDASGIALVDRRPAMITNPGIVAGGSLVSDLYGGHILNADTARSVATLPTPGIVAIDGTRSRVFVLWGGTSTYVAAYDASTFEELGRLKIPDVYGSPPRLLRWGTSGLAFRTDTQVYVIRTDWVPAATSADLELSVVVSRATDDQPLVYSLRVVNRGGLAAANVGLTDSLPAGASFLRAASTQGSVVWQDNAVVASLGSLAVGAEALVTITALPGGPGEHTNSATVSASTPDPAPGNNSVETTINSAVPALSVLRRSALNGNALASDGEHLLVALSSSSRFRANCLATIDPTNLAVQRTSPVGSNPDLIRLSDDKTHAFLGLRGAFAIQNVDLATATAGTPVSFDVDPSAGASFASDLIPLPASNSSAAVVRRHTDDAGNSLAIYDGAVPRSLTIPGTWGRWLARGTDNDRLHVIDESYDSAFTTYSITPQGPSLLQRSPELFIGTWGVRKFESLGDLIVSPATGDVVDSRTRALVAALGTSGAFATDADNHRVYVIAGQYGSTLTAYDSDSWAVVGTRSLGNIGSGALALVRWGRHGLAFLGDYGEVFSFDVPELVPDPPLRVILPSETTEGVGTVSGAGRVEVVYPVEAPLVVALTSSQPGVLSVPASVTIPAGAKSATFSLVVSNNSYLNGTRAVTVSPTAAGPFVLRPATIDVHDDEVTTLTLSTPTAATEGSEVLLGQGVVTLAAPAGEPVSVYLTSSDRTELIVPRTVVIPAGQTTANFILTAPDDDLLDGPQTVTITASMPRWNSVSTTVTVADNDARSLHFTLPASTPEYWSCSGTINLSAKTLTPLRITLHSSPNDVLQVTGEVTIPAGYASAYVGVYPDNNAVPNLSPTVTITAEAAGFTTGSWDIVVVDDDPATAEWEPIAGPKTAGVGFNAKVLLKTLEGKPADNTSNTVTFSATNERGVASLTQQEVSSSFGSGVYEGTFTIQTAGQQTQLVATPAGCSPCKSASFVVNPAPTAGFRWDPIPSPRQAGVSFPATLRSADQFGNPTTNFTGSAALSAQRKVATITAGTENSGTRSVLGAYGAKASRTTALVLASELSGASMLRSLALDLEQAPPETLKAFTIRIKSTTRSSYETDQTWDTTGWTTVYRGDSTITATGWTNYRFTTPFAYDGTSNLLVDLSYNNPAVNYTDTGIVRATFCSPHLTIGQSTADASLGDPLTWTGTAQSDYHRPNLRFSVGDSATVAPTSTSAFTAGVWTGQLAITESGADVVLSAVSGALRGDSAPFAVFGPLAAPVLKPEPIWTAGDANTIGWSAVAGANNYQAQRATIATFSDATETDWLATTNFTFTGLANATRYFYRTRAAISDASQRSIGPWSATVFSTQDTAAPALAITSAGITTSTAFNLTGTGSDTSGLASVTVDGTAATTADAFAHWSHAVVLQPGMNTFSVEATDLAVPAQTTQLSTRVLCIPSAGDLNSDPDGDGLSGLMEYALALDPIVADSNGATTAETQFNWADGHDYLIFTYRRRNNSDGLAFHIETSTDLKIWSEVSDPEILYWYSNQDGVSSTVGVRLQPAITAATPRRFVRLKVTTP